MVFEKQAASKTNGNKEGANQNLKKTRQRAKATKISKEKAKKKPTQRLK
jgi:hypothetical protein